MKNIRAKALFYITRALVLIPFVAFSAKFECKSTASAVLFEMQQFEMHQKTAAATI